MSAKRDDWLGRSGLTASVVITTAEVKFNILTIISATVVPPRHAICRRQFATALSLVKVYLKKVTVRQFANYDTLNARNLLAGWTIVSLELLMNLKAVLPRTRLEEGWEDSVTRLGREHVEPESPR